MARFQKETTKGHQRILHLQRRTHLSRWTHHERRSRCRTRTTTTDPDPIRSLKSFRHWKLSAPCPRVPLLAQHEPAHTAVHTEMLSLQISRRQTAERNYDSTQHTQSAMVQGRHRHISPRRKKLFDHSRLLFQILGDRLLGQHTVKHSYKQA